MILRIPVLFLFLSLAFSSCRDEAYRVEFNELDTGTDASIRALHVVSDDIVWASGSGGTFLVTDDGGESWTSGTVSGAGSDDFRNIHAWNEKEALLFGISYPGRAYYTSDAGDTWEMVYENNTEGIFFNSLNFADDNRGMALSDPVDSSSFVIHTEDRGQSWERLEAMPLLAEGEYNFAASNSCIDYHADGNAWIITGGQAARVFISHDHGKSWMARETGLIHGNESSGVFSVSFIDEKEGIVVGGTYDEPALNDKVAAWSEDGGYSWQEAKIMPRGFRSCVIWMNRGEKRLAFAIGKTGCDYSGDGGRTWLAGSDVKDYYTARAVTGTLKGYAAGAGGRIASFEMVK
ncbi:MAG: hypothetical protein R6V34_05155 [Bacteroidales bacterium]